MKTILVCYEERALAARVVERTAELAKLSGANIVAPCAVLIVRAPLEQTPA